MIVISIQESSNSTISICPNPIHVNSAYTVINIKVNNFSGQLVVYNSLGERIKTIQVATPESSFQFEVSNWHSGSILCNLSIQTAKL